MAVLKLLNGVKRNPGPDLGQAQKYGSVNPVNRVWGNPGPDLRDTKIWQY